MADSMATIIGAAITGFLSLIVFVLSSLIPKITANKAARQKIYVRQLKKLFEPLVKLLEENHGDISEEVLEKIKEKICNNIALAPAELIKAYHILAGSLEDKEKAEFIFKDTVYSNYNWIRKSLSYPYDGKGITFNCLGEHERMKTINKTVRTSMLIIMGIVAISLLLTVMYMFMGEEHANTIMDIFWICYTGFAAILLIGIILSPGMIRNQGSVYKKLKKEEEKRRQKPQNERRSYKVFGLFVRCKTKEKLCQGQDEDEHQYEKKPPEMCEK